ncbi:MAG: alternate F1F0 ATPase, F1 subunit alpha [Planctomycetes bacterium]|nr:alternate F1F0 ATPase, F1 subunit alpha [Planctomycetota bacterium]
MAHSNSQTPGSSSGPLRSALEDMSTLLDRALVNHRADLTPHEVGRVIALVQGTARVRGLPNVSAEELVRFSGGSLGLAFNLEPNEVGVVLLSPAHDLKAGAQVHRTGRILDFPVGEELLGRVVNALGQPVDERGPLRLATRRPIEQPAPPIMHRAPVTQPLQTGIKVIDALLPIGRGQRELILGDRQTGKTAIALDAILNQHGQDVICIYCAIGQRSSAVAKLISALRGHGALGYCVLVVATGDDPPGVQFLAPYAATTLAEFFMHQGRDVLIVYDDLTRHARAYRELSLLLRRPPGREAYPGDVFYIHSRLLERATHLREEHGGGSLTALPIVETQGQNISAYIPTNLISITDGQIYLSPDLFRKGILPAVDVGRSVSRVGGKAQRHCFRAVAGELRLSYAQFEELEVFARFGTRLDDETRSTLERGRRVREVLKQPQYEPLPVADQVAILFAASEGLLDTVSLDEIADVERAIRQALAGELPVIAQRLNVGDRLTEEDNEALRRLVRRVVAASQKRDDHANT